jgi:hypothetical protein
MLKTIVYTLLLEKDSIMLKFLIVFFLVGVLVSLASGAIFFFKDQGRSKRTLYALGVRISFAVLLVITLVYGIITGELGLDAPWHRRASSDSVSVE